MPRNETNHLKKGTRVGHLEVVYRGKRNSSYFYHCKCDCGSLTNVAASVLEHREQTSCMCRGSFLNVGQTYEKLTVKERISRGIYRCDCACGKKDITVLAVDVLRKNVTSCGCNQKPYNRKVRKDSSTGIRGVSVDRKRGKYRAYICINGKNKYLGTFDCPEKAKHARELAEADMRKKDQQNIREGR